MRFIRCQDKQDFLLKFPCYVGDIVYSVPKYVEYASNELSGVNENNRVHDWIIAEITLTKIGWRVECIPADDGNGRVILKSKNLGKTWFSTRSEAEQALERMEKRWQ